MRNYQGNLQKMMPCVLLTEDKIKRYVVKNPGSGFLDRDQKNFFVKIFKNGQAKFYIRYRPGSRGRGVNPKTYCLGEWPSLSVSEAREKAQKIFVEIRDGRDPLSEQVGLREEVTLEEFCKIYLSEGVLLKQLKPDTIKGYTSKIKTHIIPYFGKKKLSQITKMDVQKFVSSLMDKKGIASQCPVVLQSIFDFAIDKGLVETNPVSGVKKPRSNKRDYWITNDEYKSIFRAINEAKCNELIKYQLLIIINTGARKSEIQKLKWKDVRLDIGKILLKDSKTGQKEIILPETSQDILSRIQKNGEFVFSIDGKKPISHLDQEWRKIREASGVRQDLVIHSFRGANLSFLATQGSSTAVLQKLASHHSVATTMGYISLQADAVVEAANKIDARQKEIFLEATTAP